MSKKHSAKSTQPAKHAAGKMRLEFPAAASARAAATAERLHPQQRFEKLATALTAAQAHGAAYPAAVLDLGAVAANMADLAERAGGKPIRLASKSIRCAELTRAILATPNFQGVLAYSVAEALRLVSDGITDDAVVGYPVCDPVQLQQLHSDPDALTKVTLMIDRPEQLDAILAARAVATGIAGTTPNREIPPTRVCLDIDCGLRLGPVHLGARRSAIRTAEQAAAAATTITRTPGITLVGVMGYESQVAGVTDTSPAVALVKHLSVRDIAARRGDMVRAVERVLASAGAAPLEFVNGGGTGSFETTRAEECVTELAAGSGIYGPHLFDGYRTFKPVPALYFATQITRRPAANIVTTHGAGWIASGASGPDRAPLPVWPSGLSLTKMEGAGEVQTPLIHKRNQLQPTPPQIGDTVWWRHTKAGELAEHVNELWAFGAHPADIVKLTTYRGEGAAYL